MKVINLNQNRGKDIGFPVDNIQLHVTGRVIKIIIIQKWLSSNDIDMSHVSLQGTHIFLKIVE